MLINNKLLNICKKSLLFVFLTIEGFLFLGCNEKLDKPIIIWTNKSEFASYVELFNASQDECKAIVVYKESPVESFPPEKDEVKPDIVIGPWLKNETIRKNFTPLDYLFHSSQMKHTQFYSPLLEIGNINDRQYLLPVSFNIPAIIFSKKDSDKVTDNYILSLDEIKQIGGDYNKVNKNGIFTAMGFAPRWNSNFIYTVAKLQGADFKEKGHSYTWNQTALDNTITYLKEWTLTENESTTEEDDFSFKYLYMPAYKIVSTDRCLFSFISSKDLFSIPEEKLTDIDFRWLHYNNKIPVDDEIISLGLYKKSKNTDAAELFILWLMNEDNQKAILERNNKMKLNTKTFGIAGGFSAIKTVNERVFTQFSPLLMGNLPIAEYLTTSNILPAKWELIKEKVILPYLLDATNTTKEVSEEDLQERIIEWNKQYF